MNPNSGRMISFDVTALFTSIPLEDVLEFLREKHSEHRLNIPIPIDQFLALIRLCVSSTIFSFEDKVYQQSFGVAMGSPLSPILANLYMEHFETNLLPRIPVNIRPILWLRYVDDVFSLYPHDDQLLEQFLVQLNSLVPSIKFTKEDEVDRILPFLDVKVHRSDESFKFSIYRKPTHSESYIHFFSFHPLSVKKAVASGLFLRALRFCDPEFLDQEFEHIFDSFKRLGYPKHILQQSLSKAKRSYFTGSPEHNHNNRILKFPYHPQLLTLQHLLRHQNINLVFTQNNTLKRNLVKNSNPKYTQNTGIYIIPCSDCNQVYVGETGRDLDVRVREHKYACRTGAPNSAVARHTLDDGHRINFKEAAIVCNESDIGRRRVIEGALIHLLPTFSGNASFSSEDTITSRMICKSAPLKYHILYDKVTDIPPGIFPGQCDWFPSHPAASQHQNGHQQLLPPQDQPPG